MWEDSLVTIFIFTYESIVAMARGDNETSFQSVRKDSSGISSILKLFSNLEHESKLLLFTIDTGSFVVEK